MKTIIRTFLVHSILLSSFTFFTSLAKAQIAAYDPETVIASFAGDQVKFIRKQIVMKIRSDNDNADHKLTVEFSWERPKFVMRSYVDTNQAGCDGCRLGRVLLEQQAWEPRTRNGELYLGEFDLKGFISSTQVGNTLVMYKLPNAHWPEEHKSIESFIRFYPNTRMVRNENGPDWNGLMLFFNQKTNNLQLAKFSTSGFSDTYDGKSQVVWNYSVSGFQDALKFERFKDGVVLLKDLNGLTLIQQDGQATKITGQGDIFAANIKFSDMTSLYSSDPYEGRFRALAICVKQPERMLHTCATYNISEKSLDREFKNIMALSTDDRGRVSGHYLILGANKSLKAACLGEGFKVDSQSPFAVPTFPGFFENIGRVQYLESLYPKGIKLYNWSEKRTEDQYICSEKV
ncbi:hypothetical protein [Bdellovibrio sp. HCB274]|uniref:hypothetical protein n=1 Tax=Bdellovibrio sp. HCB274 TaxID=3394361 RepID=UPI0039B6DE19